MRAGAVLEELDAAQEVAVGDAGGAEHDVLTGRQLLGAVDPAQVDPGGVEPRALAVVAGHEAPLDLAAHAHDRGRRHHAHGRAAGAHHAVDVRAAHHRRQRGDDVAVADQLHPGAGLADLGDQPLVPRAVEDDDRQLAHVAVERPGDAGQVGGDGPGEVDLAGRGRRHDELLHVGVRRLEQAALLGQRDDRDGVGDHLGRDVGALDRVDGDVDLEGVLAALADLLADVEHRRLVPLALADDDLAVDVELVEHPAHGVGAGLVDQVGVTAPGDAGRGDRRLLGHADGVEDQGALELHAGGADQNRVRSVLVVFDHASMVTREGPRVRPRPTARTIAPAPPAQEPRCRPASTRATASRSCPRSRSRTVRWNSRSAASPSSSSSCPWRAATTVSPASSTTFCAT